MIHPNTWESWLKCQEDDKYDKLVWKVAKFFYDNKSAKFTDRQVKDWMFRDRLIPVNDMNMVRPKITNLIDKGFLVEDGVIHDDETKRHVRLVKWQGNIIEKTVQLEIGV